MYNIADSFVTNYERYFRGFFRKKNLENFKIPYERFVTTLDLYFYYRDNVFVARYERKTLDNLIPRYLQRYGRIGIIGFIIVFFFYFVRPVETRLNNARDSSVYVSLKKRNVTLLEIIIRVFPSFSPDLRNWRLHYRYDRCHMYINDQTGLSRVFKLRLYNFLRFTALILVVVSVSV